MAELQVVETKEIEEKADSLFKDAESLIILSSDQLQQAGGISDSLTAILKQIDDSFDPIITRAHQSHKEAIKQKKKHYEPVKKIRDMVDGKMTDYNNAEEEKRREQERKIQEELRKKEEEQRLKDAVEAEASGNEKEAEAILDEPAPAPVVLLPRDDLKVQGRTMKSNWKYRVLNESLIPAEYWMKVLNDKAIRGVVTSMKGKTNIPGIQVYDDKKMVRTGR